MIKAFKNAVFTITPKGDRFLDENFFDWETQDRSLKLKRQVKFLWYLGVAPMSYKEILDDFSLMNLWELSEDGLDSLLKDLVRKGYVDLSRK